MTELSLKLTVKYAEAAGSSKELAAALQRAIEYAVGSGLLGEHVEEWLADVHEVEEVGPPLPLNWAIFRLVGEQEVPGPAIHEFHKLDENVRAGVVTAFVDLVVDGLSFLHRPTKRRFAVCSVQDYEETLPRMKELEREPEDG